jgi:hypothetical protein
MSKITTFIAAALIVTAGSASATTMLVDGISTYAVNNGTDISTPIALPAKQAAGLIIDFTFSFTGTLQNNDYFGLWFGSSTGPSFGLKANCGGDVAGCTDDLYLRMSGTSGPFVQGSNLSAGTSYHLMGYLHKTGNSSTYNALDVWLNPTRQEMISLTGADAKTTGNIALSSFTNVGFRTVNIDSGVVLKASDINVRALPEPGSLALMGLAAAGLGFVRRRKQA